MDTSAIPTSFCGVGMAQTWEDLLLYESLLNARPEIKVVVELGTGEGGLALYLATQCGRRGLAFYTCDLVQVREDTPGFHELDVFHRVEEIAAWFRPRTLLVCDNGDKPRELATYAPHLQPGDLVAVHDWNVEVGLKDLPNSLVPVYSKWCTSMTQILVRVEDDHLQEYAQ